MARVRSQEEPWSGQTPAWLDARARAFPERPALVTGAHRWSFGQLDAAASRVAHWLAGSGITAGTRAAVLMRNGASFVATTHALTKLGAVMVPLHARLTKPELVRQLDGVGATAVICDGALAALGQAAALPTVRALVAEEPEPEPHDRSGGGALGEGLPCPRLSLSSIQGIVHTSATSGTPKGVLLTYGNHWWSAVGAALHLGLQRDDCWLACLPLSHVGGLAILWRSVIYGVPVILHDAFEPDVVNREIDDGRVTLISLVGTMLQRLIDARGQRPFPQRLRAILLGGGPISPGRLETCVRRRIPIAPTYGLTETASQVATLAPEDVSRKTGSAGQALFPTELRIAASGRRRTAPGQVGEILVRGPVVMRGTTGDRAIPHRSCAAAGCSQAISGISTPTGTSMWWIAERIWWCPGEKMSIRLRSSACCRATRLRRTRASSALRIPCGDRSWSPQSWCAPVLRRASISTYWSKRMRSCWANPSFRWCPSRRIS